MGTLAATTRYIKRVFGKLVEQAPIIDSAGAGDAGKIIALDSTGKLDPSFMPVGIAADSKSLTASENIAAGDFVNVWDDSGAFKVRLADASTSGKEAHGFALSAITSGAAGVIYFEGTNTQVTGATPGEVYLDPATPGGFTDDVSGAAAGDIIQSLGVAVSATEIKFEPQVSILLS